jgi:predicted nucleotide-binding protein (sugar kinase/HSP70/actin superfamily)
MASMTIAATPSTTDRRTRLGIPRALFYYAYFPFWEAFFSELGAEIVVSGATNKRILQAGLNVSSGELCLPIKLMNGHVADLVGRCDFVFLPYIISTQKGSYYCPKLIATPDIAKAVLPGLPLMSADVDVDNFLGSLFSALREVASKLTTNPVRIYAAFRKALERQELFERHVHAGALFEEALAAAREGRPPADRARGAAAGGEEDGPVVAVIGHTYLFNDPYISFDLLRRLRERGARVVTSDSLSAAQVEEELSALEKGTHWSLGNRVVASVIRFSRRKDVRGIIYVTPFGCSSDSLVKEYIDANLPERKPMLVLTVDEHSGDAGIVTRLEAFFDMIARRPAEAG